MQTMNSTKALTQLGFVTARGLDNGELGALLLSNKVTTAVLSMRRHCASNTDHAQTAGQIHDMEEKRRNFVKLEERSDTEKKKFKSADQVSSHWFH